MAKRKTYIKSTDKNKPWNKKRGRSKYKKETEAMRKTFLIVCEGQTEALYFKAIPVRTADVRTVNLEGQSKIQLVNCTEELSKEEGYDEIWCVFDMDVSRGEDQFRDFDNAISKAYSLKFKVAYSNDAFELWFYLHYHYTDIAHLRFFYYEKLSALWQINYEKTGKNYCFSTGIFRKLQKDKRASLEEAVERAESLFQMQRTRIYHEQNPVTLVYQLVTSLQKECDKEYF
jgi:hypothetical protein